MFKKIAPTEITAEEIKNRILAYASLQAATATTDENVWSGNIETYTLYLRLSGIYNEKKFTDVLSSSADTEPNSGKYVYLKNEVFLQETAHLNNHSFVEEMYRSFLRREADPGGLAGNVEQLNNGASRKNLVIGIRKSGEADNVFLRVTECLDDRTFLDIAQDVYLEIEYPQNRQSQDLQALSQGKSRREVFQSLRQFQELKVVLDNLARDFYQEDRAFIEQTNSLSEPEFVSKLYLVFLKREADPGGLEGKVEQLKNGVPRLEILTAVRTSEEAAAVFVNLTSGLEDRAFLEVAHQAYLKRELTPKQQTVLLEALHQGISRQEILTSQ